MKRLIFLFFLCCSGAMAQVTVTGTVTDAASQAFANGTYRVTFVPVAGFPGPYSSGGSPFPTSTTYTGALDGSGAFSISMIASTAITPIGSSWAFNFCPLADAGCYSVTLAISGAGSITSSILPPAIKVQAGNLNQPKAYADAEVTNPVVGFVYYNLTTGKLRVCTVAIPCTWADAAGGGGAGTVTSLTATSPVVITPSPTTTTGVISCPTCSTSSGTVTHTVGALSLSQPVYGNGTGDLLTVPTELSADAQAGADICAKISAAVTALPATGGTVRLSAQNYAVCAGSLTISKDFVTLRGAGGSTPFTPAGATTINFPAATTGIILTGNRPLLEDFSIVSASSGAGSDDGIQVNSLGGPVLWHMSISHFGGRGVVFLGNSPASNDLWHMEDVESNSNFGDGFQFATPCTDNNVGIGGMLSASNNGGIGFNVLCGQNNLFESSHAAGNTGGAWNVVGGSNYFLDTYVESGTGSSFVINASSGYNRVWFASNAQPTTITVGDTTSVIYYKGSSGFLGQNRLVASPTPGAASPADYLIDSGGFANSAFAISQEGVGYNILHFTPSAATLTVDATNGVNATQYVSSGSLSQLINSNVPNDGTTGTTALLLAKINSSGNAIKALTSDTGVRVYPVTAAISSNGSTLCQPATTGNACLVIDGQATLTFDAGGVTAGHYVGASTTTAGTAKDLGTSVASTLFCVGSAPVTVAASGTGTVNLRDCPTPTMASSPFALAPGWLKYYGDGSDGAVNISGTTTSSNGYNATTFVCSASLSSTAGGVATGLVILATTSIAINAGCTINADTIVTNGDIGGSGGGGGGGTGAGSAGQANELCKTNVACTQTGTAIGAAGTAGGAGGGTGGNGNTPATPMIRSYVMLPPFTPRLLAGGGKGGAGGSSGPAGGTGGGIIILAAPTITLANGVTLSAVGQNGTTSTGNNVGGSGGGGGGVIIIAAQTLTDSGATLNVTGGTGGGCAAFTGCGVGGNGGTGWSKEIVIQ
jgi:hypothetical protein